MALGPGGRVRQSGGPSAPLYRASGRIRSVLPAGPWRPFEYDPETLDVTKGVGGWQVQARPHQADGVFWGSRPLAELTLDLFFDGFPERSVEGPCLAVEAYGQPTRGGPPPVVQISYAGVDHYRWVVQDIVPTGVLRRFDGRRIRATLGLTLLEHVAVTPKPSPADSARVSFFGADPLVVPVNVPVGLGPAPTGRGRTFRSRPGDTLPALAVRAGLPASRWRDIAAASGLRDPERVPAGTVIHLPDV